MNKILFTLLFAILPLVGHSQNHPNILWIIAEDMSQDLACYGNALVKTPTLDELATKGMKFTNMYTTAGVCSPSRTAIATGMYQTAIGAMHMRYSDELKPPLPDGVKTIAHILRDNGYQTFNNSKDDYMFTLEEKAFQHKNLDELDKNKPFFAKYNSFYTHRIFAEDTISPVSSDNVKLAPYYPNVRPLREDLAAYYENIQLLDREVKQILEEFEKRGLLKNTIIFFFSDHGSPSLRGKYWLYDSGIQIPFLVYIPKGMNYPEGYKPNGVNSQLLSAIDISATTLELAGVDLPEYLQGKPFLGKNKAEDREFVYASIDRIGGVNFKSRGVRSQKYKYIKNFNNGLSILEMSTEYRKARLPYYNTLTILDNYNKLGEVEKTLVTPLPYEELYDLENDPFETNNLAYKEEYQDVRIKMESVLMGWMIEIDDKGLYPDSPEIQKHFIDYRTKNQESFRKERLKSYLQIEKQLKNDGEI